MNWEHIEDVSDDYTGEAHHVRLAEPVEVDGRFGGTKAETAHFVISSTVAPFGGGPETYAFPADEDGNVDEWGEVGSAGDGMVSRKGTLDWEAVADALAEAAAGEGLVA